MKKKFLLVVSMGLFLLGSFSLALATPVDLELVLAVDVSGSVDATEFNLQRQGYVDAFNNPVIVAAIQNGSIGSIASTLVYWAGSDTSTDTAIQAVGWTQISDLATSQAFATAISTAARPSNAAPPSGVGNLTGVMTAINFSSSLIEADNGFEGTRNVIDVSGDGKENTDPAGWPDQTLMNTNVAAARNTALAGLTDAINGLAILTDEADLLTWYSNYVVGGTDSFAIAAANFTDFGTAVQSKIITEISGPEPIPEPATMLLLGTGLVGVAGAARRRKKNQA